MLEFHRRQLYWYLLCTFWSSGAAFRIHLATSTTIAATTRTTSTARVLPCSIKALSLLPQPARKSRLQSIDHGITLQARCRVRLASTPDDDPEMIEEEEFSYAPTTERDTYVSEGEQAEQANALAAVGPAIELHTEISNSFMQYALSIIMGRAIPDARDGLKPVHRRILYAMDQLSLYPNTGHRKCARVVGEVLGKFHPHGDMAVYDALVRLAQHFSTAYPLIDGHGNFGSIDADPAAAMRYTECRLTKLSQAALLEDLQDDTVDFLPNFDGNEIEPAVLPAKLPILLLNGSSGIAVGMATNIPPHNLNEIMTACTALVKARQGGAAVTDKKLLQMVPGPDFPTGASILSTGGTEKLYTTGNGGIVMRAVTKIEKITTGRKSSITRTAIIVTELPYQVNKAALLEKIAGLVNEKKLDGIADLRDESDRDGIRVVIELKRDAVAAVVLNNLYKKTPLQTTFSGNFLALMTTNRDSSSSLVPQRFTLRQAMDCFLDFRFETIRRKSQFQLTKVNARSHIVAGLLMALDKVDMVIQIVRASADQQAAREALYIELGTSSEQTDAILKLQLGQLTRLNKGKLESEKADLEESRESLTHLLEVDDAVYDVMREEFIDMMKRFGGERKSSIIVEDDGDFCDMDLIENSRSVIVVTRGGYIKRMPLKTFESQGRGTRGKRGTSDGGESADSEVAHCFTCNDHDTLLMVTQNGIAYGLRAYQVPIAGRTAKGQPIPSVLPVRGDEVITAILPVSEFSDEEYVVLTTEQGWIKRTPLDAFEKLSSRGLTIATLEDGDRLKWCHRVRNEDDILIGTVGGMATRFGAAKLRPTGRTSRGVRAMKLREGDTIADMNVLSGKNKEYILTVTSQGYGKRIATSEFRAQARGGVGVIAIKFKRGQEEDKVSCLRIVKDDEEILVITARGIMVRQKASDIPSQGRSATGVMVQRVDDGDHISSVSIVPQYEEIDG
jgi:DNA gyrase subunit A